MPHISSTGGVTITVDGRSIRAFHRKVDTLVRATRGASMQGVVDYCNELLCESSRHVPVDTGALGNSAGFVVRKQGDVNEVRCGYGMVPSVNRRTGQDASEYMTTVHEMWSPNANENTDKEATSKFFENAVHLTMQTFPEKVKKNEEAVWSDFAATEVGDTMIIDGSSGDWNGIVASRIKNGFSYHVPPDIWTAWTEHWASGGEGEM